MHLKLPEAVGKAENAAYGITGVEMKSLPMIDHRERS